jgi:hypothetical protein
MYTYKGEKSAMWMNSVSVCQKNTTHLVKDSGVPITRRTGRVFKHNRAKTITRENLLATVCIF